MASSTNIIWCPSCHKRFRVPENAGGKTLRCKKCKFAFLISDALTIDPELAAKPAAEVFEKPAVDAGSVLSGSSTKSPNRDSAAAKAKLLENDFDDILEALENPNSAPSQHQRINTSDLAEDNEPPPQRVVSKRRRKEEERRQTPQPGPVAQSRPYQRDPDQQTVTSSEYDRHQGSRKLWSRLAILLSLLLGGASAYWLYSSPVPMLSKMEFSILKAIGVPPTWISDGATNEVVAANDGEDIANELATIRLKGEFEHLSSKPPREVVKNEADNEADSPFDPGEKDDGQPNVEDGQENQFAQRGPLAQGQRPNPNANANRDPNAKRNADDGQPGGGVGAMKRGRDGQAAENKRPRPKAADVNGAGGPQMLDRDEPGIQAFDDRRDHQPRVRPNPGRNDANGGNRRPDNDRRGMPKKDAGRNGVDRNGANRRDADRQPDPLTDEEVQKATARGLDPKTASQFKLGSNSVSHFVIDGRYVFLLTSSKTVQAFDWKIKNPVDEAKASGEVTALSVSKDTNGNPILWIGTKTGSFESWRLEDGKFKKTGEHKSGAAALTMVAGVSSDKTSLAVVAGGSRIRRVWLDDNWEREIEEIPVDTFDNQILAIRLSPDGTRIFASDGVKWVNLDVEKGSGDVNEDVAFKNIRAIAFSPNGKKAVATDGREVALINTSDWSVTRTVPLALADQVGFPTNDSVLVLKQGFVEQYATSDFRLIDKYWASGRGQLSGMDATESHILAIDRTVGEIGLVFELANSNPQANRGGGNEAARPPAVGGTKRNARIGNPDEQPVREIKPIPLPKNVPHIVGQSPGISPGMKKMTFDSQNQLVLTTSDGSFLFADWRNGDWLSKELKSACDKTTSSIRISPDDKTMLVASDSGAVNVWDLSGEKPIFKFRFDGHAKGVTAMDISADGATVVSADAGGRVICWGLDSGDQFNVFDDFSKPIISLSIQDKLVTATDGQQIVRGRINSGKGKYVKINNGSSRVWISKSSDKIAVLNGTRVSIYDRSSIKLLETIKADGVVTNLVFGGDGRTVYMQESKFVSQWDWRSGRRVAQYDASPTKIVFDFVVSADDKNLAIIEGQGSSLDVRVFEVQQ